MVGYHHVLMILIAVAIILLCTSSSTFFGLQSTFSLSLLECVLTIHSTPVGRMLIVITPNTRYLPYLYVL
jgi:hypothetical protein